MRETITQLRVAECVELSMGACGCTRDAIFFVSRRDVGPIRCQHRSALTKCFYKNLLKWIFFTNEDFLIWKTQVRPSTSGNRISFLGSSTDSHQITTTVKTLQRLIYTHTADSENAQRNRGKKGENLKDVKLAPTRCQNLSISRTDCF
jgi:hypothetical protein